jgi:hypothetical protein
MPITLVEQPQSHTPIYNDMVTIMGSTIVSNSKFLFCLDVEIIIEGASVQYLGRLKTPATVDLNTSFKRGYFNIKELLKASNFFQTKRNYLLADISHSIRLTPGEEYAVSASGTPVYYPSSSVINYVGFNGALRLDEFRQFVPTNLINTGTIAASSGIGQYIMSSYTQAKNILKSTLNELTFLCNGGTNTRAIVSYYNGNALITTQTVAVTTANRTDITINASYNALAVPINANKIGVRLERISNGQWLSPQYEYNLVEACSKYPTLNVYFQNKWGGYDSFIFNKKSTKRDSINRKTYQKQDRYFNGYNSYDPAIRTYDSEIKTHHTLSTDWVTEEEMTWLSELVESNNVQFSYDSEFILGRKAEVTITVTENPNPSGRWFFDPYGQEMTATMGAISLSAIFPASSVTQYDFADEFYFDKIKPVILASNWATYFDIDESGVTSEAIVFKMVAKQKGTAFNLTSPYAGSGGIVGSQMSASNNISGITEVLPNTIPIQIEDTSFEFKTRDNDKLFQLTINAVETSIYNRQNL